MRTKIIAVNAFIVALAGLLSFVLVRASLRSAIDDQHDLVFQAHEGVNGAAARLQLDGLSAERWLDGVADEPGTADVLTKATASARSDAATQRADELVSRMKNVPLFDRNVPTLVAVVDSTGRIVGRNGSTLNRGDDLTATCPGLKATMATGQPGSDVWVDRDRYLATYVAVRDEQKRVMGALVIGRPLNDTLSRVSETTTGRPLALVIARGDGFEFAARSASSGVVLDDSIVTSAKDIFARALAHQQTDIVRTADGLIAIAPLTALSDGNRALLVSTARASAVADPSELALLPILGATAVGLMLVLVSGWLLGSYITRPINAIEEALLAVISGQTDRRLELDHAELGGLAFRIDQLLNELMGVEEDTTDAEGRVSGPPNATNFTEALAVDDRRMLLRPGEGEVVPKSVGVLALEPPDQYYARLFREYLAAKQSVREATDHITEQAFVARIRGMEEEAARKYGRPVRYKVEVRDRDVVLIAVPL
jgi:hypothetical protein